MGLVVLALLVTGALAVGRIVEQSRERARFEAMRERLGELRRDAEDCRLVLAREEDAFRRFARRVDSLRSAVRGYEDDGGVPEEVYEEYLAVFDRYNEAVPRWEARADSLRDFEAECRALVETHNLLADSVRAVLEDDEG